MANELQAVINKVAIVADEFARCEITYKDELIEATCKSTGGKSRAVMAVSKMVGEYKANYAIEQWRKGLQHAPKKLPITVQICEGRTLRDGEFVQGPTRLTCGSWTYIIIPLGESG
jgi:hypothetical protein